jgi:hypothetical protein
LRRRGYGGGDEDGRSEANVCVRAGERPSGRPAAVYRRVDGALDAAGVREARLGVGRVIVIKKKRGHFV